MEFRQLFGYLINYRGTLILAGALMLGESVASLATPWFAGRYAEELLHVETAWVLSVNEILVLWLILFLVQAVMRFFSTYLVTRSGAKILAHLSNRLYDHIQALPIDYFHDQKRGDVLALLSNDVTILSHFFTGTLTGIAPIFLVLTGAFVLMAWIDLFVALLVAVLIPIFVITLKLLGRRIRPISMALMQKQADTLAIAEENIGLLPLIKSFVRESTESKRFQEQTSEVLHLRSQQLKLQAILSPVLQLLASAGILLVLWVSSEHLLQGELTIPELISLLLYGLLFARPVSSLANLYGHLQQARGSSERLLKIFSVAPEQEADGEQEMPPLKGEICFKDVRFHYPGQPDLFQSLNFQIEVGETVAITGPNGVGKSTLLHLLIRFYEPVEGHIEIDGIDIRKVSYTSLRRQIGLVGQHTLLLDGTIEENIRYGRPDAGMQEVERAAQAAHAHHFISQLPDGYLTRIGEQGIRLSGGQKQRIALARILLSDPVILLLDEATAMFDVEGEHHVIRRCRELLKTRTVIIITHRPASLALADRIIQL
jgi:ABC-type multidrug transport system fused ATPase/permease subunit